MYEQMKNNFIVSLSESSFTPEQISKICISLDSAAFNYNISKRETSLVLYKQDVPQLVKAYIVSKSVEGFSKSTLYNRKLALSMFFRMINKNPNDVTANDVRIFLYRYQEDRNVSNRSLETIRTSIAAFFKWCQAEGYIDNNPVSAVKAIKYERKERKPLTQIELEYLRNACQTPRERAIVELFYSTGCRIGELVILKKSDIDWVSKTIHLFGKGKKHRTGFLNAKAEVAIREYMNSRTDENPALFVTDRRPYTAVKDCCVRKILSEIVKRTGGAIENKVTPHVIRHTTATRMLENNASISSIQMLLGHENVSTTMIYAHNSLEMVQREHNKSII